MKKIIFAIVFFASFGLQAQETTVDVLNIVTKQIDTLICGTDTLTTLYLKVLKTSTDNGTDYPDISIDTILIKSGECPADSLEVMRQLLRDATEIQNRASNSVDKTFQFARRGNADFVEARNVYNSFTGEDIYIKNEDRFWSDYEGRYRIFDIQASTSVTATLIRVGATQRYRLEIEEGEVGAGTRYAVILLSKTSFQINSWNGSNYKLYLDRSLKSANKVFREAGYLKGGTDDNIRIVKIR